MVLRFASDEAARAWYSDPDYAPVRDIRHTSCSNNSLVIAQPFDPPTA